MTRDDYIKLLKSDETYKIAISMAKTEEERRFVEAMAAEFLLSFYDALEPMRGLAEKDPGAFMKRLEEERNVLLTNEVSGSSSTPANE